MIQQVLEFADYGVFTGVALVLFVIAFLLIVVYTLTRPKREIDRAARMPMDSDQLEINHDAR